MSASFEELLQAFDRMPRFRRHGRLAPHKCLVILFALGHASRGACDVGFDELENLVGPVLSAVLSAESGLDDPFVRLSEDGFWVLRFERADGCSPSGAPSARALRAMRARAGFDEQTAAMLRAKPERFVWASRFLLSDPSIVEHANTIRSALDVP